MEANIQIRVLFFYPVCLTKRANVGQDTTARTNFDCIQTRASTETP